ncbi:DUF6959 family protein [Streptomyces sp. NBC_00063]|uniref:DUF6959 family protein n=1 Tax=Streptomyces sp. NBC_00063 TaxID=2975638 RepID=UPI003D7307F5
MLHRSGHGHLERPALSMCAAVLTMRSGFPRIVMQGDSLHILRGDVAEVAKACEPGDMDEDRESAGLLLANLDALLAQYEAALDEAALDEHEIPPPY